MILSVFYTHAFVRQLRKLPSSLQDEVVEKVGLFRNTDNHPQLKVHKLKGRLKDRYGFSVTYAHRVIFCYVTASEVALLSVGDHDVYKQ